MSIGKDFKAFLERPKNLSLAILKEEEGLKAFRSSASLCMSRVSEVASPAHDISSKLERDTLKILESEKRLNELKDAYAASVSDLTALLTQLENVSCMMILLRRYIDGMPFEKIAQELGYSIQSVFRLHRSGQMEAEKLYLKSRE